MTWVVRVHVGEVPVYVGQTDWVGSLEKARRHTRNAARNTARLIRENVSFKVETLPKKAAEAGAVKVSRARSTGTEVHLYAPRGVRDRP